jgi:amino acid adenylation domain-containing protein
MQRPLENADLRKKSEERFWFNKLKHLSIQPFLPTYLLQMNEQGEHMISCDEETRVLLNKVAKDSLPSKFVLLLATLRILYFRYTQSTDTLIITPTFAGSSSPLLYPKNSCFFRASIQAQDSVKAVIQVLAKEVNEAKNYLTTDLDGIALKFCALQEVSMASLSQLRFAYPPFTGEVGEMEPGNMLFSLEEHSAGLRLRIRHTVAPIHQYFIQQIGSHFFYLLKQVLTGATQEIGQLEIVLPAEKEQLLYAFNATNTTYPTQSTISKLLEKQVERTPLAPALVFEDQTYTYTQVNSLANQIAHYLLATLSVQPNEVVGVLLPRSAWSAITMLGIIKAGACYVPLDRDLPAARLQYLLDDATPRAIFTTTALVDLHGQLQGNFLDLSQLDLLAYPITNPLVEVRLDDLSFIIYTSGSTGMPKGVMQTHRTMLNLLLWDNEQAGLGMAQRLLQYAAFAFDASLHDIYFSLSNGGVVYVLNEEIRLQFTALAEYIREEAIEIVSLPYSVLSSFFNTIDVAMLAGHCIKHIISTGEQLLIGAKLEEFLRANPTVRLHNFYGPSETHVVTAWSLTGNEAAEQRRTSIGKPIANSQIYILDAYQKPVPIGVTGEIYIGGSNLAKGYLGKEALTQSKFVPHFLTADTRLYISGDLGRWLPDGRIEYIGRIDNQLKIRGFRVELGEIEKYLLYHPAVQDALVLAKGEGEDKQLIAYIISSGQLETSQLRNYLLTQLPDYMVPGHYVSLDRYPVTSNGKVDKSKLPSPSPIAGVSPGKATYEPASHPIEEKLVQMWEQVLGTAPIGIRDNFFDLGGHSLKATRIIALTHKELSVKISVREIFLHPTVQELAKVVAMVPVALYQNSMPLGPPDGYEIVEI